MYMENCVLGPFTEFPPPFGEWGYWVPELIPFASWDCYGLCIHSERCDVWEFDPGIGLTIHRPSIKAVLLEIADAVRSGREPRLRRKGEAE